MKSFRLNRNAAILCVAMGAALMTSLPAHAGSTPTNLGVSANVAANCTITSVPVAFGAYDPIVANAAAALAGSGSVTIACTKSSVPTIGLGLGVNAVGAVRNMISAGNLLPYELYQPPTNVAGAACGALTTVWNSVAVLTTVAAPSKAARTYNVCGSIAAGVDAATGVYADTVVATVNF
jgi:spore coat protein U-like protein